MLNIALFGPPGAGKGTQSKLLIEKYNLTYIATGDILRQEIAENTELGKQAKDIIAAGELVPDEIIVQIIEKKIKTNPDSKGILFDGFPRTLVQAYILEGLLMKMNTTLSCMISLEVPEEKLIQRLVDRGKTSERNDDNMKVIKNRLNEYKTKTAPVGEFYNEKDKLYKINGVGTIDEIHERITQAIDNTLKQEWLNIVIAGPPGAGKGTQGRLLAEKYNLYYISTGSNLRKEVKNQTKIGKQVKPYLDKGELVPDEIVIQLIEREVKGRQDVNGFVFKGFPRTIIQAYILDGLLMKVNSSVSICMELKISTLDSIKRLSERGKSEHARSYDKTTELIVSRLEEYQKRTAPVIDYYQKMDKTMTINAQGTREEVFDRLAGSAEKAFRNIR
ncbi:MAG: adenylate kinase [Bacteroidales bacterium]|nr:adenylate kinase [Bacteroidales bacterium]MCF8338171.1 adenylate kinase [Bacteroidales bacterium]